jgi:hypothetical protein
MSFSEIKLMCGERIIMINCSYLHESCKKSNLPNLHVSAPGYAGFLVDASVFGVNNVPKVMISKPL